MTDVPSLGIVPMSKHRISVALPVGLLAVLIAIGHAAAQTPTGVFAGKTVNLIIGFGPGGGYDLWARILARHIGRHLPGNPTVTPQNMEGAGSYRAANFIYNVAPKDGTAFALIARDTPLGPLTGAPGAQFDATRAYGAVPGCTARATHRKPSRWAKRRRKVLAWAQAARRSPRGSIAPRTPWGAGRCPGRRHADIRASNRAQNSQTAKPDGRYGPFSGSSGDDHWSVGKF
jgi:hypothetical protein